MAVLFWAFGLSQQCSGGLSQQCSGGLEPTVLGGVPPDGADGRGGRGVGPRLPAARTAEQECRPSEATGA